MDRIILCDFDGTITTQDTLVKLLDTFAEKDWHFIEKKVRSEGFGNRIALRQEFALCNPKKATKERIVRALNEHIEIDPYFKPFLEFCEREGYEFLIVSGGFSLCIETILKKYNLGNIPYYANNLLFPRPNATGSNARRGTASAGEKNKLAIGYPHSADDCKDCGNCKTMHLRKYMSMGYYIIYIGDSTTDRCPARYADLVFAKGNLSEYCLKEKINHIVYETFADIQSYLSENIPAIEKEYMMEKKYE